MFVSLSKLNTTITLLISNLWPQTLRAIENQLQVLKYVTSIKKIKFLHWSRSKTITNWNEKVLYGHRS